MPTNAGKPHHAHGYFWLKLEAMFLSKKFVPFALLIVLLTSCVAERRFNDEVAKVQRCEEERASLKTENLDLAANNAELTSELEAIQKRFTGLKNDTNVMGTSLRRLTNNYDKLNDTYERLLDQMGNIRDDNAKDAKRLTAELERARTDLIKREDQVNALELAMNKKQRELSLAEKDLTTAQRELGENQRALADREARVKELEGIMARKDSAVIDLKNKVAKALLGFTDKGLTVVQKNGKVYVSMEESLLFASGSWNVDVKGQEALKQLATVLETQPDVNIMIEGHTDNVPYKGSGQIKDNWDLSVMRATAIVKILTANSSINPTQLTAAGRSEYLPLNSEDTKEAKAENRRTDIIISPKLDELFQMLEQN